MIFEMVMGCPASGKTTYARQRQLDDWVRITYQDVEKELKQSFGEKISVGEVIVEMVQRSKEALRNRYHVVFDGNCLSKDFRVRILTLLKQEFGRQVHYYITYMETDKELCMKRNRLRVQNNIQDAVMELCFAEIEPPQYSEGWDLIKTIQTSIEEKLN